MSSPDPAVDALYTLLRTGELSPGERVDQRTISERLGISRTPLREALRALASDGVLIRTPNAGYAVAKLSAADLLQYYSIRTYLETEVLRTIKWPTASELDHLRELNERCAEAGSAGDVESLVQANREFHFGMFRWSPLTIMISEIERVWRVSEPYRALHLSNVERRKNVARDHGEMIAAIENKDTLELIQLLDRHRAVSRRLLQEMLGSYLPPSLLTLPQSASNLTPADGP